MIVMMPEYFKASRFLEENITDSCWGSVSDELLENNTNDKMYPQATGAALTCFIM